VPMSTLAPVGSQSLRIQNSEGHAMVKVFGKSPVDGGLGVADLYDTIKSGFEFKEKMDKLLGKVTVSQQPEPPKPPQSPLPPVQPGIQATAVQGRDRS